MNKQIRNASSVNNLPVARSRRVVLASVAAVVAGMLSMGASQAQETQPTQKNTSHERHFNHGHHGHHGAMDPAHAEKRFERMTTRLVPDATPEQKTRLSAIAKAAFNDLRPLREKSRAVHAERMRLLSQPTIDRGALERVRETQQQLADQKSRRVTQAFADASEVLTPAQRVKAVEQLSKHRHHRSGHGPKAAAAK